MMLQVRPRDTGDDRVFDVITAIMIITAGASLLYRHLRSHTVHRPLGADLYVIWVTLLLVAGIATLIGTVLRRAEPGHRQSVAYALELFGWSFAALMILAYSVAYVMAGGEIAVACTLWALISLMLAKYRRHSQAFTLARKRQDQ